MITTLPRFQETRKGKSGAEQQGTKPGHAPRELVVRADDLDRCAQLVHSRRLFCWGGGAIIWLLRLDVKQALVCHGGPPLIGRTSVAFKGNSGWDLHQRGG